MTNNRPSILFALPTIGALAYLLSGFTMAQFFYADGLGRLVLSAALMLAGGFAFDEYARQIRISCMAKASPRPAIRETTEGDSR